MSGECVGPATVRLGMQAATREEAVRATAELLQGDTRVGPWDTFWAGITPAKVVELGGGEGRAVCLAHGRGADVTGLALAAARLARPVPGENGAPLSLFFVFAIPLTMSEEYLRAVGALARACGDAARREALDADASPEDFAAHLAGWIA